MAKSPTFNENLRILNAIKPKINAANSSRINNVNREYNGRCASYEDAADFLDVRRLKAVRLG